MEFITTIFNELLFRPLFNALILVDSWLPGSDFGISIIVLTIGLKFIFFPLTRKGIEAQKNLSSLQPKLKEIQEKYKNDKEAQTRATMQFYKEHKVNPFGGCLPLLFQLPILIALYRVLLAAFDTIKPEIFYSFVTAPQAINPIFLGTINLADRSLFLAVLAGIFQFFYAKLSTKFLKQDKKEKSRQGPDFQRMMQSQMTYFMPILTVFIAMSFPAGLALYWAVMTLLSVGEFYLINKLARRLNYEPGVRTT